MIRIILHLSVLVIIQPSSEPFQRVFTLFLSNYVGIPIELYSSIYFKLLFPHSFYRCNQLYLMDNVNKPKWESCINRREFAICTEKTCHSIGDFSPPRRPPFHQKALPAIPPTELGYTNLLLRVSEYCTAVTFFPKAQCAATACGFQHPSFGGFTAKKRYPCT